MKIEKVETQDANEVNLVREFIMQHHVSDGFPSFQRCEYSNGTTVLLFGYDLDSETVASASKSYAYVRSDVLKEFCRFCRKRQFTIKFYV